MYQYRGRSKNPYELLSPETAVSFDVVGGNGARRASRRHKTMSVTQRGYNTRVIYCGPRNGRKNDGPTRVCIVVCFGNKTPSAASERLLEYTTRDYAPRPCRLFSLVSEPAAVHLFKIVKGEGDRFEYVLIIL